SNSPIRMAMMAITTSSSISVKPSRRAVRLLISLMTTSEEKNEIRCGHCLRVAWPLKGRPARTLTDRLFHTTDRGCPLQTTRTRAEQAKGDRSLLRLQIQEIRLRRAAGWHGEGQFAFDVVLRRHLVDRPGDRRFVLPIDQVDGDAVLADGRTGAAFA